MDGGKKRRQVVVIDNTEESAVHRGWNRLKPTAPKVAVDTPASTAPITNNTAASICSPGNTTSSPQPATTSLPDGRARRATGLRSGQAPQAETSGVPNKGSGFQRPPLRRSATGPTDSKLDHLHQDVTSEKLWLSSGKAELESLPDNFASVDAYMKAFMPLLFEECRAQLRQEWEEACTQGAKAHMPVKVTAGIAEDTLVDWKEVKLEIEERGGQMRVKDGWVAVLSPSRPEAVERGRGGNSLVQAEEREEGEVSVVHVAGVVRHVAPPDLPGGCCTAVLCVYCPGQASRSGGPYAQALAELRGGQRWWLTPLSSLVTSAREYEALQAFRNFPAHVAEAVLRPRAELFPPYTEGEEPPLAGCLTPAFTDHLQRSFNGPQLRSIRWVAAQAASGSGAGPEGAQMSWPFTLVQGPPGTGKTHTVWGMLNVIHLVHFQHYYAALLKKLAPQAVLPGATPAGSGGEGSAHGSSNLARLLPQLCPKPRVLVCAPSNAATDELLARVLDRGLVDGELRTYRPDVARVGSDAQSRAAQAVSVERRAAELLAKRPEEVRAFLQSLRGREAALGFQIGAMQREVQALAAAGRGGAVGLEPEALAARDAQRDQKLQQLAALHEERDKVVVELERLYLVQERWAGGSSLREGQVRRQLEASFAREAEIVFTTLSSSGRDVLARLRQAFNTVVIDEAAQASELAVLAPLRLGCQRCVLVGDPQQLPATIISQLAQALQLSRSLFERFQTAGCPALMLTQQYRMHPQIRDFPSRHFYQGQLTDDASVVARPAEPYHREMLLRPYVFFDVAHGREAAGPSTSLGNPREADFAVALFQHFCRNLPPGALRRLSVGCITPYREQVALLRRAFDPVLAELAQREVGAERQVTIATVDAYQGQERDIVILSCVRAASKGAIGFVADIRRMNVALTRARRSLWVLGNASVLARNSDWEELIVDAKARGVYVEAAQALEHIRKTSAPLQAAGSSVGATSGPQAPTGEVAPNSLPTQDDPPSPTPYHEAEAFATAGQGANREPLPGAGGRGPDEGSGAGQEEANGAAVWQAGRGWTTVPSSSPGRKGKPKGSPRRQGRNKGVGTGDGRHGRGGRGKRRHQDLDTASALGVGPLSEVGVCGASALTTEGHSAWYAGQLEQGAGHTTLDAHVVQSRLLPTYSDLVEQVRHPKRSHKRSRNGK